MLFERLAIAWLKEATPAAVACGLGLTWEDANGIVERAVRRGLARRASAAGRRLGIDEHSYLKHFQSVTMVVDLDEQTVLHVADDRSADTLAGYFESLSIDERLAIEAIAMDMWDPYRRTVLNYVPDGDTKIVFDKFHVMRHAIEAMDQVRRREQGALRKRGDRRLTGTKFLWLKNQVGRHDFTAASRRQFRRCVRAPSSPPVPGP
jgi:transposase